VYFRFYVIDNDVPNASAFPNGMIFIHTGLLKLMENEAQLASVLGHEIAHVTYEHGAKRYKATKITNSGLGKKGVRWLKKSFKKKINVDEEGILGDALDKALEYTTPENIMNIFDKGKETQSDRVGLFYMQEAGYDPREAANFWQIMMASTKDEKFMNKIFKSTLDMITNVEGELDEINFDTLGKDGTDMLVETILETVYTSHPLSIKRYGDINRLLSTTYESTDFTQTVTGKADFDKYMKAIKGKK
jgi:beta-barrel assembly-enhancing protease